MDIPTKQDLQTLIEGREGQHVSLFMPKDSTGINNQQDRVRLKNLLREVEERLAANEMRAPDIQALLAPGWALLENSEFWRAGGEGLALFLAPGISRAYRTPHRFHEGIVINTRFHIKPLLPVLGTDGHFFVLALTQNNVRLLDGSQYCLESIGEEQMSRSLREALKYDEFQRTVLFHDNARDVQPPGGNGPGERDEKTLIRRYYQRINDGLLDHLGDCRDPLVLIGLDYLQAIYRQSNKYRYLADEGISTSADQLDLGDLHKRAWTIVEPGFKSRRRAAEELYAQLSGSRDQRATDDVRVVVPASFYARVDTLFLTPGQRRWGRFHADSGVVEIHGEQQPGDEDLLNLAAAYTIINGGDVYSGGEDDPVAARGVAAILRY